MSTPLLEGLLPSQKTVEKSTQGKLAPHSFSSARHSTTASVRKRLGDGISGDISEYWEHLFDVETGYPKEEIQNEFEVVDLDLLIIDYVAIYPEYRGLRIAESAIHRTIDIFGAGCGLVACKPWPLQFTPSVANDQEALKRLALPNVSKGEAIRKLRSYWSRLGFWPLGNTGIYLLSISQRGCHASSQDRAKSLQ